VPRTAKTTLKVYVKNAGWDGKFANAARRRNNRHNRDLKGACRSTNLAGCPVDAPRNPAETAGLG
jgi:hypothetical protein